MGYYQEIQAGDQNIQIEAAPFSVGIPHDAQQQQQQEQYHHHEHHQPMEQPPPEEEEQQVDENYDPTDFLNNLGGLGRPAGGQEENNMLAGAGDVHPHHHHPQAQQITEGMEVVADNIQMPDFVHNEAHPSDVGGGGGGTASLNALQPAIDVINDDLDISDDSDDDDLGGPQQQNQQPPPQEQQPPPPPPPAPEQPPPDDDGMWF